jgi:xanthine dehydrogenase accessory factor
MWLHRLHAWIEQGIPCVLVTVTEAEGPAPRKAGAKMAVSAEGETEGSVGGGAIEHRCLEEVRKVLASGEPRTLRFALEASDWRESAPEERACAGRVTVFLEPVLPPREIVAFGGGHISERLSRLCEVLGIPFRVYDERPEFASRERFPAARGTVCASYEGIASHIRLSVASHCIVLTHGHAHDERVLEQLLRMPFLPYIGMVGSSRKSRGILERLAAKAIPAGANLHTPAGLALGGGLPGDIALSILAEIKLVMEGGRPEHLGMKV